jgi:hypothetical protein
MHTMDVDEENNGDGGLNVQDIDAYWLQREVAKAFGDAVKKDERLSQKLAEEVLKTLEVRRPEMSSHLRRSTPPFLVCRVGEPSLSRPVGWRRSAALHRRCCVPPLDSRSRGTTATPQSGEEHDIENNLVLLLDMDKFALVKLLLKNRLKIVWCTRLARAQNEEEVWSSTGFHLLAASFRHAGRFA